jgi:predicted amidohydrolase
MRIPAFISLIALASYYFWRQSGRVRKSAPVELYLQDTTEYGAPGQRGVNGLRGNLLAIQPFMTPSDYATEATFWAKLDGYLSVAQQKEWLNDKTIAVFPEYMATWLVAAGEKENLFQATSLSRAMRVLILSNIFSFLKTLLLARAKDRIKESLFRMKARQMTAIYHNVFSHLAQKYGITIVAGSIVLPSPLVKKGRLEVGVGPLHNISVVYKPNGSPCPSIVRKVYPIMAERPFTAPTQAADLPVFDTPAGRLGVLICADSWYPAVYEALAGKCDIVVVPNNLMPEGIWWQTWAGYNPGPAPADVAASDVNHITEGEAWLKYALAGRLLQAGAKVGMHVFLHGRLWDLSSDGHTIIVDGQKVIEAQHVAGAALVNYWL